MQIFIVGSPLETAQNLDKRRLWKQILETDQIIKAARGLSQAWRNHPCCVQYRQHIYWLQLYHETLKFYWTGDYSSAKVCSDRAETLKPKFHTQEFLDQMKRRLYTKDKVFYHDWKNLGESDENWYFIDGIIVKYKGGKRIKPKD